jgi:hypothetical protein
LPYICLTTLYQVVSFFFFAEWGGEIRDVVERSLRTLYRAHAEGTVLELSSNSLGFWNNHNYVVQNIWTAEG